MSKIQNSIWIKNTNKTGQETMNLLKLLKDLGVFKEKPKKRKAKRKEEVFEDEEILQQPSGGGGGGSDMGEGGSDMGEGGSDIGGGNITSNLLALKGALSAKNTEEENLKKLKEETELQLGKLRDAQQDLTRTQQRFGFGFRTSTDGPKIEFLDEEEKFFPPKESVVSEPAQEFNREGASVNIPDKVMEQDVTPKVSPEQGQFEDEEETGFETMYIPAQAQAKSVEEQIKEQTSSITDTDKFDYLAEQYDLVGLARDANATETKAFVKYLYDKFDISYKKGEKTEISKFTMEKAKQKIKQLINQQYEKLNQ